MAKPAWSRAARTGELRRHKNLVFFACEGLVALHDERKPEEDYMVMTPGEFEERAHALGKYANRVSAADPKWLREEGRICKAGANDMLKSVQEARHMGDPTDPVVQAFWAKHRNRKSKVTFSDPCLPELPRGKVTGRTAEVDGQAALVPDDVHLRIHRPPVRRQRKGIILDV